MFFVYIFYGKSNGCVGDLRTGPIKFPTVRIMLRAAIWTQLILPWGQAIRDRGLFTNYVSQKWGVQTPHSPLRQPLSAFSQPPLPPSSAIVSISPTPPPPFVSPVSICLPPPLPFFSHFCQYIQGHCLHE